MGEPMASALARLGADAYAGPWGRDKAGTHETDGAVPFPFCWRLLAGGTDESEGQRRMEHDMTNQELRERLFDVCAANLTLCFPEVKDTFLCPFCLRKFTKEAVRGEKPMVILAHCVPEALKGALPTLACADCDNTAGRDIDIHLINRLETTSFFRGESPDSRRIWYHTAGHRPGRITGS